MGNRYMTVIREARSAQGMSQAELADRLGVSRNTVAGWETGHARPDLDLVPSLCRALRLPLSRFFGVKGGLSAKERHVLDLFLSLEEEDQRVTEWQMEALAERRRAFRHAQKARQLIRIYESDLGAAAGFGAPLDGECGHTALLVKDDRTAKADEVITVSGRSMEPTFFDGDRVLVQRADSLREGEIGIFLVDGEGFIKEYRSDGLHSHNPSYGTMNFDEYTDVRCAGRVLGRVTEEEIPTEAEIRAHEQSAEG